MCGVCQEIKNPTFGPSLFAAGFAGVAAGVQLSWQRITGRWNDDDDDTEADDDLAVGQPSRGSQS